jgi:hypothetical protein
MTLFKDKYQLSQAESLFLAKKSGMKLYIAA